MGLDGAAGISNQAVVRRRWPRRQLRASIGPNNKFFPVLFDMYGTTAWRRVLDLFL